MWPTTSRTRQPSHSDGRSQSSDEIVWRNAEKSAFSSSCSRRKSVTTRKAKRGHREEQPRQAEEDAGEHVGQVVSQQHHPRVAHAGDEPRSPHAREELLRSG